MSQQPLCHIYFLNMTTVVFSDELALLKCDFATPLPRRESSLSPLYLSDLKFCYVHVLYLPADRNAVPWRKLHGELGRKWQSQFETLMVMYTVRTVMECLARIFMTED